MSRIFLLTIIVYSNIKQEKTRDRFFFLTIILFDFECLLRVKYFGNNYCNIFSAQSCFSRITSP